MRYITRDIEKKIQSISKEYACILITGARQVGKTTLLKQLMSKNRTVVSLDNLQERHLAANDPALFLQMHSLPILIDEVQYAPELFSYIKMAIDNGAAPSSFWLTGSQPFKLMELAQESLAGRIAVIHLPTLSQHEIFGKGPTEPFAINLENLKNRNKSNKKADTKEIYTRIWNGSMPGHISGKYTDRDLFYSSYLQTYIERDIRDFANITDVLQFTDFIRSAACRVGQILNFSDIAKDVGISVDTAKRWFKILEKSDIIFFLRSYSNNLLKRTIKFPKLYFFDTGLVAYLTRYSSPEILANGAMNGAILENFVISEIIKTYHNNAKDCLLWYYRDTNNNEIDLVMESDGELHPIEIKRTSNPGTELTRQFKVLDKTTIPRGNGAIICMAESLSAIGKQNYIIPVALI